MVAWRDTPYAVDRYLFIDTPPTVFAALVDQATFTYPLAQVTYDTVTTGAYTDIEIGQTVLFGTSAGADDLGRTRVRKTPTSSVLYVGWSSNGTRDGELNLANNAYITVIDDFRAWAKIPRIQGSTLYKDYDLASQDPPPIAVGGPWICDFVDASTGLLTVDFTGRAASVATAVGATISSEVWDFADGDATGLSVDFVMGRRWVTLTATDSNAQTHTTRLLVVALARQDTISYVGASFDASSEAADAHYAFDGDTGGFSWVALFGDGPTWWIEVTLPAARTITGFNLTASDATHSPAAFSMSVDGSPVTPSWSGITWEAPYPSTQQFDLDAAATGTTFRLTITDVNDGVDSNGPGINEIELILSGPVTNYIEQFEVTTQTLTRNGQTIEFNVHEDIDMTTYPDGAAFIYIEKERYNGVLASLYGPNGSTCVKACGWLNTETEQMGASELDFISETTLQVVDIGGRMRNLAAFAQGVERDSAPANWQQVAGLNTDRYMHYLLHWHSTVLDVCSYTQSGTGDTYALPNMSSPGQNLWEQLKFRTASIGYELAVTQRGELQMVIDPLLLASGDRTATVIETLDENDWTGIHYTHQRPPRVHWNWGDAIIANTQESDAPDLNIQGVYCVAPGQAPGQGGQMIATGQQLVVDRLELNERTGNRYATRDNATDTYFEVPIREGGDIGIDPARMEWVRLTISATYATRRGLTFTNERFLPFEVDIRHDNISGTKEVTLRLERENEGQAASTFVPETGDILNPIPSIGDWASIDYSISGQGARQLYRGVKNIAAFDTNGNLYLTSDFDTPAAAGGPTWSTIDLTALSPALSGAFISAVGDPFSPLYVGTGGTVNGWILTKTGIYGITDIFGVAGGPTLALQHTLATANPAYGEMQIGLSQQNWVAAAIDYVGSTGTKVVYSTTGGASWSEVTVSSFYATVAYFGDEHSPAFYMSPFVPGLMYCSGFTSTGAAPSSTLRQSTNYGAAWSVVSSPTTDLGQYHGGLFTIPWADNGGQLLNYHANFATPDTVTLYRTEANGVTLTDVTPGGGNWGTTFGYWGLGICPINRQRLVLAGWKSIVSPTPDQFAIWTSRDAGTTWTRQTNIVTTTPYLYAAIAGNDPDVVYAWGGAGIGYSQDFLVTGLDDRTASLSGTIGTISLIVGG